MFCQFAIYTLFLTGCLCDYAPGARYNDSAIQPIDEYPYGQDCAVLSYAMIESWQNRYLYKGVIVNHCDRPIYHRPMTVRPSQAIVEFWNVFYDDYSRMELPMWATTWGLTKDETLEFGFISNSTVTMED